MADLRVMKLLDRISDVAGGDQMRFIGDTMLCNFSMQAVRQQRDNDITVRAKIIKHFRIATNIEVNRFNTWILLRQPIRLLFDV